MKFPSTALPPYGKQLFLFLLFSGTLLISVFYAPPDVLSFTICPFKNITGIDCPGCGLTRAFCSIGKGNLTKALRFNKLSLFVFAAMILLWLRAFFIITNFDQPAQLINRLISALPFTKIFLTAFTVYGLIRIGHHFLAH